jgi:hypothetical protein
MTKRRLLRWSLPLAIFAAFAVWLEPTRVVWGWLRGEAFYQGRPTSWWAGQVDCWDCWYTGGGASGAISALTVWEDYQCYPKPSRWRKWINSIINLPEPNWPDVLKGDPESRVVLKELLRYSDPYIPRWAEEGLERIKAPHAQQHFSITYVWHKGPSRFAPGWRSEGGMLPNPTRIDGKRSP